MQEYTKVLATTSLNPMSQIGTSNIYTFCIRLEGHNRSKEVVQDELAKNIMMIVICWVFLFIAFYFLDP